MRLFAARYTLTPRRRLGSRGASGPREGALLRLEAPGGALGYADLHPWPELGDAPLSAQLSALERGEGTPLTARALCHARADAEARVVGRPLLAGLSLPESHFLLPDIGALEDTPPEAILAAGFTLAKVKLGGDLPREVDRLAEAGAGSPLRYRLDLNASVGPEPLAAALWRLQRRWDDSPLGERVDFLEDPCPYHPEHWARLREAFGVGLALDREGPAAGPLIGVTHRVIKPAAEDPEAAGRLAVDQGLRIVVTSYLDHPVGQLHAAHAAGLLRGRHGAQVVTAGLLSQRAYAETPYSEALPVQGPRLLTEGLGPGIGLEDLLSKEAWVPLGA